MPSKSEFARLLNKYLEREDRSAKQLAEGIQVVPSTVARWTNGETLPNHPKKIDDIAKKLNLSKAEHEELRFVAGYPSLVSPKPVVEPDHPYTASDEELYPLYRQCLYRSVESFWVKGVLKQSLHNEAPIMLGLEDKPSAVESPWEEEIYIPKAPDELLPPETNIVDVFDKHHKRLLILGEPGSGKTTMLLELCESLLKRTQIDSSSPLPVVFNLSSWATQQLPIEEWLVTELHEKYQIAKKVARSWVENDALALLFDGLDEVHPDYQENCVDAVNAFLREHLAPLVVCCRSNDDKELEPDDSSTLSKDDSHLKEKFQCQQNPERQLQLNGAVEIQRLSETQISDYCKQMGAPYTAIHETMQNDAELKELAQSPLFLKIMAVVYQGDSIDTGKQQASISIRRKQLFDAYIKWMFEHKIPKQVYTQEQFIQWLTWLATNMIQHQQTLFFIEHLQPEWLQKEIPIWLYRFITGLIFSLLFGLLFALSRGLLFELNAGFLGSLGMGFLFGLSIGVSSVQSTAQVISAWKIDNREWIIGLFFGVSIGWLGSFNMGLSIGLGIGLGIGLLCGRQKLKKAIQKKQKDKEPLRETQPWMNQLLIGLIVGLGIGVGTILLGGSIFGRLGILSFSLLFGLVGSMGRIRPTEKIVFSWHIEKGDLMIGLSIGVGASLLAGSLFGLLLGLSVGLLTGLLKREEAIQSIEHIRPNQGIRHSARSMCIVGSLFGLNIGLFLGILFGLKAGLMGGLLFGLSTGLISYGGLAYLQHWILRSLMYIYRYAPLNYAHFLDCCVARIFLHRVGGGYIFIHRMLMEHFAQMTEQDIQHLVSLNTHSRPLVRNVLVGS